MNIRKQRGISIIIVIFLLAGVSVMALSMVNLAGTQDMSSFYAARGAQAYFAARAGIEHAASVIEGGGVCADMTSPINGLAGGFSVTIDCAAVGTYDEGDPDPAADYTIFRLTATASSGNFNAPDVANRQITATVRSTP